MRLSIWYNALGMKELRRSKFLKADYRLAQRRRGDLQDIGQQGISRFKPVHPVEEFQ